MLIDLPDEIADMIVAAAARIVAARAERERACPQTAVSVVDDERISEAEAAELVGISPSAMQKHRERGTGPEYRTHRGRYRYQRQAVIDWAAKKLVRKSGHDGSDDKGEGA